MSSAGWSAKSYKKLSISCILAVWVLFPKFLGRLRDGLLSDCTNLTCSCVPSYVSFVLWAILARRSVQNYKNSSFFGIFSRLSHFPQVFGQVKEWLILELHGMIKVPNAVGSSVDFNLLCCPEISREEYSNLWKMIVF